MFQDDFTLPTGSPLSVESGMGGSVNTGSLSLANIFQASASSTNNTTFDFTNGPQTAVPAGSTFQTGSATGLFNRTAGGPYALSSTAAINLSAGGQINYSNHVNVLTPQIQIVKLTNGTNNDSSRRACRSPWARRSPGRTTSRPRQRRADQERRRHRRQRHAGQPRRRLHPSPVLSGGFNVGDTNHDGLLDPGETWQYTASGHGAPWPASTATSAPSPAPATSATPRSPATNPDHYYGTLSIGDSSWNTRPTASSSDDFTITARPDGPSSTRRDVTWTHNVTDPGGDVAPGVRSLRQHPGA